MTALICCTNMHVGIIVDRQQQCIVLPDENDVVLKLILLNQPLNV